MTNTTDIFKSCFSPGYLTAYVLIIAAQLFPSPMHEYLHALFFGVLGILCMYNFKKCGRYHCKITGPGYFLVGILTLLLTLDVVSFPWFWLWIIFGFVTVLGFGLEYNSQIQKK